MTEDPEAFLCYNVEVRSKTATFEALVLVNSLTFLEGVKLLRIITSSKSMLDLIQRSSMPKTIT